MRAYLFTGFPWLSIGYAHVEGPLFALAPLAGIYGIGVLAATAAAAFVGALHAIRPATTRAGALSLGYTWRWSPCRCAGPGGRCRELGPRRRRSADRAPAAGERPARA
ncbi:MAG: hypothetical protein R3E68_18135 [Burkholderiaceae bacterium]